MTWGSQFHKLMQQRELGLPIENLLQEAQDLDRSVRALINAAPDILDLNKTQNCREAEHSRTLAFNNYLLTLL